MVRNEVLNQNISRISYNSSMFRIIKKQSKLSPGLRKTIFDDIKNVTDHIVDCGDYFAINESGEIPCLCETYDEYEYSSSEIYIDCRKARSSLGSVLLYFVETLCLLLCQRIPNKQVCIFISINKGRFLSLTARFHIYRSTDFYLADDLDAYHQPILRFLLNTADGTKPLKK